MARILTPIALDLPVDPQVYRLRQETDHATIPLSAGVVLEHRGQGRGGYWSDRAGEEHGHRVRLELDENGDVPTADATRYVRTPAFTASKLRAWTAIELWFREVSAAGSKVQPDRPTDGVKEGTAPFEATVRFRLWNGSDELFWNAANGAWEVFADDEADRNTAQEVQDNFASLASTVRTLAVVAYLDTSDPALSPVFFGARVLFQARILGGADDAVLRTVVSSLRSELTVRGTLKWVTSGSTSTVQVPPTESALEAADVVEVAAAFNLTDDPDETTDLTGTLAGGTFTFDAPIAGSKTVLLEFTHRPDVVWMRHRDAVKIRKLPSLVLLQDSPVLIQEPDPEVLVRDLYAAVPTALGVSPPARTGADFEVRLVAEFWREAEELGRRLVSWFGGSGYRVLVSPETGLLVEARWLEELQNVSGTLASGVVELRGSVRLSYAVARRDTTSARYLVRTGGVDITTSSEKFP